MKVNPKKITLFLMFLFGFFGLMVVTSRDVLVGVLALAAFFVCYALTLLILKRIDGSKLNKVLAQFSEQVDPDFILDIEPSTRGLVILGKLKLFSRVAVDRSGIYLYKQGSYSCLIAWGAVKLSTETCRHDYMNVQLIAVPGAEELVIPWISEFDDYFAKRCPS